MFPRLTMLLTILTLIIRASASLSKTGRITLYSDTACKEAVFFNSFQLGLNVCGKADDDAWSSGYIFQSYILEERPWCDNGARAYFNVYSDVECTSLIESYEPGALYNPTGPDADGTCVIPGGVPYQAMSFTCIASGGDANDGASNQSPTQTATTTTTTSAMAKTLQTFSSTTTTSKSRSSSTTAISVTEPGTSQNTATQETTSSTASYTTEPTQTSTASTSSLPILASGSSTTTSSSPSISTSGVNSRAVRPWMMFAGVVPVLALMI